MIFADKKRRFILLFCGISIAALLAFHIYYDLYLVINDTGRLMTGKIDIDDSEAFAIPSRIALWPGQGAIVFIPTDMKVAYLNPNMEEPSSDSSGWRSWPSEPPEGWNFIYKKIVPTVDSSVFKLVRISRLPEIEMAWPN